MKKILILVEKITTNVRNFKDGVGAKSTSEMQIDLAVFKNISITIEQENTSIILDTKNGNSIDVKDYDLIYIRRSGSAYKKLASAITFYADRKGVKCFDTINLEAGAFANKLYAILKLQSNGFPIIPTMMIHRKKVIDDAEKIITKFGLPMVAKDMHSQRGIGVMLIENQNDFATMLDKFSGNQIMFQKLIKKDREYRILVLKNTIGCFEEKIATTQGEFRNNVSLGAKEVFLDIDSMPKELKELAVNSAAVMRIEIAGVDIIESQGNYYVLEINRGPGLTYDAPESPEVANIAKFFEEELK